MYLLWLIPLVIIALVLITSYICYLMTFYSPRRKPLGEDEYEIPVGDIYEPYRDHMTEWAKNSRKLPHDTVYITSYDGLKLYGRYYECKKGAPVEIMFHGYKGNGERDLAGGIERCFHLGRNILLVDHRASGRSEGHTITFGVKERYDCLKWIEYCIERFGKDVRIILTGVSMGAATVVMTSGMELPENVTGVLSDCSYNSPKEIIQKVTKDMKLPAKLVYPFIRLGAFIYGHFDLEASSPVEAVRKCRVPLLIFHGDADDFVPMYMSKEIYDACLTDKKHLAIVKGAGHGLAFPVDREGYFETVRKTSREWGIE